MATHKLELKPWLTPNSVTPTSVRGEGVSIGLTELSAETLDDMCNAFRDEVFKKAGKTDPRCERKL